MSASDTIRISGGSINTVNDAVIGLPSAPLGLGVSKFQGQLGKFFSLDDSNIVYNAAIGTVYGGTFQYVRLSPTAVKPVVGQILFYDPTASPLAFQVTSDQAVSTPASVLIAGINLYNNWTIGNYGIIQVAGLVFVKFRAALTAAGAVGCPVYAATSGGADVGFADVLTADATAALNATFLGKAYDAPTSGGLKRVFLDINSLNQG
jgi:hypothetical protein